MNSSTTIQGGEAEQSGGDISSPFSEGYQSRSFSISGSVESNSMLGAIENPSGGGEENELELFKALEEAVDAEATPKSKMSTSRRPPLKDSGMTNQSQSQSPVKIGGSSPMKASSPLKAYLMPVQDPVEEKVAMRGGITSSTMSSSHLEEQMTPAGDESILKLSGASEFADLLDDVDDWLI